MILSYTNIFFVLVFIFIFLLIIPLTPINSYLDRLGSKIGAATGIFIAMSIFITYQVLHNNNKDLLIKNTLITVDRAWLNILKIFEEYKDKSPNLINSLFYNYQKDKFNLNLNLSSKDDWFASSLISNNIFQTWEDVLTLSIADETGLEVWIAIFLQYTKSFILLDIWNKFKPNYSITTQEFGDLLFSYIDKNKPNNYKESNSLALEIYNSKEFKKILHKRNNL